MSDRLPVAATPALPTLAPPARNAVRALAMLALAAMVSGCGSGGQFKPVCPRTAILGDAADLTRFGPRGHDVTDMVLDARITGLSGDCKQSDDKLITTLTVVIDVNRGPAAPGRDNEFAYFVAVSEGDAILDKRVYALHATFPANVEHMRLSGEEVELNLPVTQQKSGAAYSVLVGFQLSPDELALNRRRGPR